MSEPKKRQQKKLRPVSNEKQVEEIDSPQREFVIPEGCLDEDDDENRWVGDTNFRYEIGGKLVPLPKPGPFRDVSSRSTDDNGFVEIQRYGQEYSIQIQIVEKERDEIIRWWLVIGVHPSSCIIEVIGWPAMIDALNRYAPMVTMDSTDWSSKLADKEDRF